jgi:hypothetical protein
MNERPIRTPVLSDPDIPHRTPGTAEAGTEDTAADLALDPGRTPGAAEGDAETIEEGLRRQAGHT